MGNEAMRTASIARPKWAISGDYQCKYNNYGRPDEIELFRDQRQGRGRDNAAGGFDPGRVETRPRLPPVAGKVQQGLQCRIRIKVS
jgi:hypothetical protein